MTRTRRIVMQALQEIDAIAPIIHDRATVAVAADRLLYRLWMCQQSESQACTALPPVDLESVQLQAVALLRQNVRSTFGGEPRQSARSLPQARNGFEL